MAIQRPLIGLQLYTVRELTARDIAGTLKEVAAVGYEGIEMAGYGNLAAPEIRKVADDLQLTIISAHFGLDQLTNNHEQVIADSRVLGNQFVICPFLPQERRNSGDDYRQVAKDLEAAGSRLHEAGLQLCYHNHAFEFQKFDGEYGLDILYANSDPRLVQAELDTYWIQYGGENPTAYIRKYAGRAPLIHIKDMANDADKSFAEIGNGLLDWPSIFHAAEAGGAVAYIVEQDTCSGEPLDSIRISIENLKEWGKLGTD